MLDKHLMGLDKRGKHCAASTSGAQWRRTAPLAPASRSACSSSATPHGLSGLAWVTRMKSHGCQFCEDGDRRPASRIWSRSDAGTGRSAKDRTLRREVIASQVCMTLPTRAPPRSFSAARPPDKPAACCADQNLPPVPHQHRHPARRHGHRRRPTRRRRSRRLCRRLFDNYERRPEVRRMAAWRRLDRGDSHPPLELTGRCSRRVVWAGSGPAGGLAGAWNGSPGIPVLPVPSVRFSALSVQLMRPADGAVVMVRRRSTVQFRNGAPGRWPSSKRFEWAMSAGGD